MSFHFQCCIKSTHIHGSYTHKLEPPSSKINQPCPQTSPNTCHSCYFVNAQGSRSVHAHLDINATRGDHSCKHHQCLYALHPVRFDPHVILCRTYFPPSGAQQHWFNTLPCRTAACATVGGSEKEVYCIFLAGLGYKELCRLLCPG